ncbi:YbaK/EbsC family protein [Spirochaeta cellobiosiphila]|uniref:YbaK/EbsC family protein n=1 Tax=Spirochaeta cellobiosiphila TaxID=504483 RepID=UPI000420B92D|nr:YbaK/EbsC family protein [Spirochaeta cellobiosiphila]
MKKQKKLNSMRFLDQQKIPYEIIEYGDGDFHNAIEVADMLKLPYTQLYKTLVVQSLHNANNFYLAIIPANGELDLKKLSILTGEKKLQMASQKLTEDKTGLKVGGISSLSLVNKNWPVHLDITAIQHKQICMSAGQRGIQVILDRDDYLHAVKGKIADIAK